MPQEFRNPLTVLHIGLATWDRLDMLRIRQEHLKVLFEYIPDRFPIDSGRFHGNMPDPETLQPANKLKEVPSRTAESLKMSLRLVFLFE